MWYKISNDSAGLWSMFSGKKTQPARCSISQLKKQAHLQPNHMFRRENVNVKVFSLGRKRAAPARNHLEP